MTPKAQATEAKLDKQELHQTKKFQHNKGNNQQTEEATWRMGKNICKPYI